MIPHKGNPTSQYQSIARTVGAMQSEIARLQRSLNPQTPAQWMPYDPEPSPSEQGSRLQIATLQGHLRRGSNAQATIDGDTHTVEGARWRGYGFTGETIWVAYDDAEDAYYAVGSGTTYVVATLAGALAANGTQNATVEVIGQAISVRGRWGAASSGTAVGCWWNEIHQRWEAALQQC